ncbi:MAG: DUF5050 domain-containing protein [Saccharofermentanales bacterium]
MNKIIICVTLSLSIMVLTLAGCNKGNENTSNQSSGADSSSELSLSKNSGSGDETITSDELSAENSLTGSGNDTVSYSSIASESTMISKKVSSGGFSSLTSGSRTSSTASSSKAISKAQSSQVISEVPDVKVDTTTINRGKVSQQGDWIYYVQYGSSGINKIKTDGTGASTMLNNESISDIHIENEWIYYIGNKYYLYRIKTDGTGNTTLLENNGDYVKNKIDFLYVEGSWIYYHKPYYGMSMMKIDGSFSHEIIPKIGLTFNFSNGWIYYTAGSDGIYKIRTDGTDNTLVVCAYVRADGFQVVDNYIYYGCIDSMNIYKASVNQVADKSQSSINIRFLNELSSVFRIADGWLYFCNGNDLGKLYKMRMNGTEKSLIYNNDYDMIGSLDVVGNWIYFDANGYGKIKTDGSQLQLFN